MALLTGGLGEISLGLSQSRSQANHVQLTCFGYFWSINLSGLVSGSALVLQVFRKYYS